jgi:hypothetical protein
MGGGRSTGDACSPDGHLLFEGTVLCELGCELLEDFADGSGVVFESIARLEGAHHVADREGVDGSLGNMS